MSNEENENPQRGWQPIPHGGEYDAEATAFLQLPPEGALDAAPLEAPGHGYVPPVITPLTPAAATDPAATGTWVMHQQAGEQAAVQWPEPHANPPTGEQAAVQWPEPHANPPTDPQATGQWTFTQPDPEPVTEPEPGRAPAAHSSELTGQWTIPVAEGDLPEESGEFTTSALRSQWATARSATLPGGAPAPWAPSPDAPATLPGGAPAPWATAPEPAAVEPVAIHEAPGPAPGAPEEAAPEEPPREAPAGPPEGRAPEGQTPGGLIPGEQVPEGLIPGKQAPEGMAPAGLPSQGFPPAGQTPVGLPPAGQTPAGQTLEGLTSGEPTPAGLPPAGLPPAGQAPAGQAPAGLTPGERTPKGLPPAGQTPAERTPEGLPPAGQAPAEHAPEGQPPAPTSPPALTSSTGSAEHPPTSYVLRVNGTDRPVTDAWIGESLLYVLRERLGLAGAKDGCSQGECGACNVQVDGRLVASCLVPAATAAGSEVRTVEGLATDGEPSDVQRALAGCGAVQCGFCIPGMAMTVHDLLEGNHAPTELETRQALCGNLCRCSGYRGVLDAVREVVAERAASASASASAAAEASEEARIPHQAPPGEGSVQAHPHDGGMA